MQLYAEAEQKILADAPVVPLCVFADCAAPQQQGRQRPLQLDGLGDQSLGQVAGEAAMSVCVRFLIACPAAPSSR